MNLNDKLIDKLKSKIPNAIKVGKGRFQGEKTKGKCKPEAMEN